MRRWGSGAPKNENYLIFLKSDLKSLTDLNIKHKNKVKQLVDVVKCKKTKNNIKLNLNKLQTSRESRRSEISKEYVQRNVNII